MISETPVYMEGSSLLVSSFSPGEWIALHKQESIGLVKGMLRWAVPVLCVSLVALSLRRLPFFRIGHAIKNLCNRQLCVIVLATVIEQGAGESGCALPHSQRGEKWGSIEKFIYPSGNFVMQLEVMKHKTHQKLHAAELSEGKGRKAFDWRSF